MSSKYHWKEEHHNMFCPIATDKPNRQSTLDLFEHRTMEKVLMRDNLHALKSVYRITEL